MARFVSRRTIAAVLTSLAVLAASAVQVFAGAGNPPFPR